MPNSPLPPAEGLMDLIHEVREMSRTIRRQARQAARKPGGPAYDDVLRASIETGLRDGGPSRRIVCYAVAAELGITVDLRHEPSEAAMAGTPGRALRVLFWSAFRRMQMARERRQCVTGHHGSDVPTMAAYAAPMAEPPSIPRPVPPSTPQPEAALKWP